MPQNMKREGVGVSKAPLNRRLLELCQVCSGEAYGFREGEPHVETYNDEYETKRSQVG